MVVLSQPAALDHCSPIKSCKASGFFDGIPEVDFTDPQAKTRIVKACEEYGFFKLVNHGIPFQLMAKLQAQTVKFFKKSQYVKDRAGPPDPFGYGCKKIGPNGDVGWIEYLLLNSNPQVTSSKTRAIFQETEEDFR